MSFFISLEYSATIVHKLDNSNKQIDGNQLPRISEKYSTLKKNQKGYSVFDLSNSSQLIPYTEAIFGLQDSFWFESI